ncbi:MAG: hypothetical protein J6C78_03830 [Muribaculaceae bacterium]|nr:hypothetical protein [Muribaculaceae bacterium]
MKFSVRHILILLVMSICGITAIADRTTRRGLKLRANAATTVKEATYDTLTLAPDQSMIRLSGYDKPLRSRHETMFVSNNSPDTIFGLSIDITYLDTNNRTLHSRNVAIDCCMPPSSTQIIKFKSWDVQNAFYYKLSPKPTRSSGTPYDVSCRIRHLLINK